MTTSVAKEEINSPAASMIQNNSIQTLHNTV